MSVGVGVGQKFGNFTLASDVKFYEDYNSIGLGGQYDLGIASLKLDTTQNQNLKLITNIWWWY